MYKTKQILNNSGCSTNVECHEEEICDVIARQCVEAQCDPMVPKDLVLILSTFYVQLWRTEIPKAQDIQPSGQHFYAFEICVRKGFS